MVQIRTNFSLQNIKTVIERVKALHVARAKKFKKLLQIFMQMNGHLKSPQVQLSTYWKENNTYIFDVLLGKVRFMKLQPSSQFDSFSSKTKIS